MAILVNSATKVLVQGITGARLVVVPDSGHLTCLEQPATVSDALASWLSAPAP